MPRIMAHARYRWPLTALAAWICGCGGDGVPSDRADSAAAVARPSATAAPPTADTAFPEGEVGRSIRRGRALMLATRDSLPGHVGNELRCVSCHLDEGRRPEAIPWTGVYARFPQYRSRNDRVNLLEDRINDCFERSLNGKGLPFDSPEMRDIVAYMAHLSRGAEVGTEGGGLRRLTPVSADTARGASVYAQHCVACHGDAGQGTAAAPPLWGPGSYNIGAGMARVRTAASFIRHNMPFGDPRLTDAQAFDVAAYINSRPRPDMPGKERDWPNGDAPPDVAYPTAAAASPDTAAS